MLISTRLSGQLEVLEHEQSVDSLNGCFLLVISSFLFLSSLLACWASVVVFP